ncbi:hypothetical protein [Streptomyces carpinensis]|uniref:Uncharacterized protein n=1 Tax=Streptomyces carpinensis TaxID=66369 RepID=A0ABV1W3F6_9ACTN|nr:hypothetical protein [Streptomyces carpinensis]
MDPGRYRHTLTTTAGRRVVRGWWDDRTLADGKFVSWVGEYGALPDAHVTLVDEQDGTVLATWPDESEPS